MIPQTGLAAWRAAAPWGEVRQVEQDLIISRALVDIFSDDALRGELRFRGGTALHKLHFPAPSRYSEDIDLVRTAAGPIGPVLGRLRGALQPWLGRANFDQSKVAPKLNFRVQAEDGGQIRLKIEINTRERKAFDAPLMLPFRVENPWFSGGADIPTFSREEMLATKMRALLQRDKGRDLYDLACALDVFEGLNTVRVAEVCGLYYAARRQGVSKAQAEERMFGKLASRNFLHDIKPLLPADKAEAWTETAAKDAFRRVFTAFVGQLPGEPWARTPEMKEKFEIMW